MREDECVVGRSNREDKCVVLRSAREDVYCSADCA